MLNATRYGPWAVVVGGSEALGAGFSMQIAKAGLNVLIIARKIEALESTAALVRKVTGVTVRTLSLDLAGNDVLEKVRAVTDDLDVGLLIYNAGAAHRTGGFLDGSLDDAMRTIKVNAIGPVTLAHHFGRKMVALGRGGIVIVGSGASAAGAPGIAIYCGAKAFGQMFAEGLWSELKPHGVDVLQVPLGAFNTPAMARIGIHYPPEQLAGDPDDQVRDILARIEDGPVYMPPAVADGFRHAATLSRREAAEGVAAFMKTIPGLKVSG